MTLSPITISDRPPTLANGWEWAPLGDVARLATGHTPDRSIDSYWNGGIPWISLTEIRDLDGRVADSTELTVSAEGIRHSSSVVLPPGTVCLSRTASIGFVTVMGTDMATSQDFVNWVCGPRLDPMYLMRALIASRQNLRALSTGSTHRTLYMRIAERFRVLLPPVEEQRRIAAMLDKADHLRANRRAGLAHLDSLTQSIFFDLFGDPVANSAGWPENRTLGDLADIRSGVTKGRLASGPLVEVPYLAVANVQDRHLRLDAVKSIAVTSDELARYRLQVDDLLLTEGGDPDKLGRGALWSGEIHNCIHQNHIFRVRLTTDTIRPLFLNWLVGSQRGKRYFLRSAKQTTGIASINLSQLRAFPMITPPVSLQTEFERRVKAVDKSRAVAGRSLVQIDQLFSALQHRAFSGAL